MSQTVTMDEAPAVAVPDPASRFAAWPRLAAIGVLIALLALIAFGIQRPYAPMPAHLPMERTDLGLYGRVIERMRHGQPYDQAAVAEQRISHYPVRPFLAVRPPLLASVLARLPNLHVADMGLRALAIVVIGAWAWRLRAVRQSRLWLFYTPLAVFSGVTHCIPMVGLGRLHETWTGLLIALSLAVRTERRFMLAVGLGLLAALTRELAMPYLLAMAVAALIERRWREGAAFAVALAIAGGFLALHAHAVMAVTNSHEVASQGWLKMGGWPFVVATFRWNYLALQFGPVAAAVIGPLALLGAIGRKDPLGFRLTALLFGYCAGFMIIGRPENHYWGMVTAPIVAVGLCFTPLVLADLARAVMRPRVPAVSAVAA